MPITLQDPTRVVLVCATSPSLALALDPASLLGQTNHIAHCPHPHLASPALLPPHNLAPDHPPPLPRSATFLTVLHHPHSPRLEHHLIPLNASLALFSVANSVHFQRSSCQYGVALNPTSPAQVTQAQPAPSLTTRQAGARLWHCNTFYISLFILLTSTSSRAHKRLALLIRCHALPLPPLSTLANVTSLF